MRASQLYPILPRPSHIATVDSRAEFTLLSLNAAHDIIRNVFSGTVVSTPQGNMILTDVIHGVDMLGNNVMINGNSMHGSPMLPMQMNHPHSRDPQYSPCQITDGSELQADGGGGGGFGMAAGRFPHQQSGPFPSGGRS